VLLALDTATSTVTAAVLRDGRVVAEAVETDHRRHAELLAPAVERVLAEAGASVRDLTAVAVGVGPGPFTGLRVGVVTARVLARVRGVEVHGVCSLDALAHQAVEAGVEPEDGQLLVATDARRKEVYWARYAVHEGRAVRQEGPAVSRPADLEARLTGLPCVGRAPLLYPDLFRDATVAGGAPPRDVLAGALGRLAWRAVTERDETVLLPAEPLYLRRPDASVPGPPKQVHQPAGGPR
jgi:tRNA threonylcarbamoyladenosine biosynthesis protein TsaB